MLTHHQWGFFWHSPKVNFTRNAQDTYAWNDFQNWEFQTTATFPWYSIPFSVDAWAIASRIAKFMGPTWGPPGSSQPQVGPMLAHKPGFPCLIYENIVCDMTTILFRGDEWTESISHELCADFALGCNWAQIDLPIAFRVATQAQSPDSKVHGANMGPTWVLSAPGGPHVGPINLVIRVYLFDLWLWGSSSTWGPCQYKDVVLNV